MKAKTDIWEAVFKALEELNKEGRELIKLIDFAVYLHARYLPDRSVQSLHVFLSTNRDKFVTAKLGKFRYISVKESLEKLKSFFQVQEVRVFSKSSK